MVMRLSGCAIALHAALVETGTAHGTAVEIAGELACAVYRRMGRIPWLLSGIVNRDPGRRLDVSTRIFRRFPFGPSAYVWESKPASDGIVAFDCLRCPVAEHFSKVGLSDLCVRTFCDLDFPLAADWSATLVRSGNIAAGVPGHCSTRAANVMLTRYKGSLRLKDWALAIAKRSNKRKARIALARRLAIIMHAMLRDGTDFAFA